MAANPRLVATDITITWDGVQTFVPQGTVVDVPAGSALEAAYGVTNLVSMGGAQVGALTSSGTQPENVDAGGGPE